MGLALAAAVVCAVVTHAGCLGVAGLDDFTFEENIPAPPVFTALGEGDRVEKLDLLVVVDESASFKQNGGLLADSLTRLLGRVLSPPCIGADGVETMVPVAERCPAGSVRTTSPITDAHVGVVTTSLGGYGFESCVGRPAGNRGARLHAGDVATWSDSGFLVWDPLGRRVPAGAATSEELVTDLSAIVQGLSVDGCGFEQPLEAWYRFLVDPEPRAFGADDLPTARRDDDLLAQRAAFLRPDSLLAIVVLSDENDCSMRPDLGAIFAGLANEEDGLAMLAARPECASDPSSPCCAPCCATCAPPDGCPVVALEECETPENPTTNLMCWDTKRRHGVDLLHPIERYRAGLSALRLGDETESVANPIFSDLQGLGGRIRLPGDVLYTAVVGVPWQELARRRADGTPDLARGLDADGVPRGGYRTSGELEATGAWSRVLGDPPLDPHMIESPDPRPDIPAGVDAGFMADVVHGHEKRTQGGALQNACIGPLDQAVSCGADCSCADREGNVPAHDPICQEPDGTYDVEVQSFMFATPGVRQLELARALGAQGGAGSVCPVQVDDPASADYGLTAAIFGGLLDRLAPRLRSEVCAPIPTDFAGTGRASCRLFEARYEELGTCDCPEPGRKRLVDYDAGIIEKIQAEEGFADGGWNCFCEIRPAENEDLEACRSKPEELVTNVFGYPVSGWCYAGDAPVAASLDLGCLEGSAPFRLLGDGRPLEGASLFLECE